MRGGRQIRISQSALQPGLVRNWSNTPNPTSGSQPKDAPFPKSMSQDEDQADDQTEGELSLGFVAVRKKKLKFDGRQL